MGENKEDFEDALINKIRLILKDEINNIKDHISRNFTHQIDHLNEQLKEIENKYHELDKKIAILNKAGSMKAYIITGAGSAGGGVALLETMKLIFGG